MAHRFRETEDDKLVETVKSHRLLYDMEHRDYKDVTIRENTWQTVAEEVGRSSEECKKRWKCIKDNYIKTRRKLNPLTGNYSKWRLYEDLRFLNNVKQECRLRRRKPTSKVQKEFELCEAYNNSNDTSLSNAALASSYAKVELQSDESPDPDAAADSCDAPSISSDSTSRKRNRQCLTMELQEETNHRDDDVDLFMKSMALSIKKLPPHLIAEAKMSILRTVMQLQFPQTQHSNT